MKVAGTCDERTDTTVPVISDHHRPLALHRLSDASDWEYVSEGGRHAVFAYASSANARSSMYQGRVLRVSKQDLVSSAACTSSGNNLPFSDDSQQQRQRRQRRRAANEEGVLEFVSSVVRPCLGEQYVDVPILVGLSKSDVRRLYTCAVEGGNIPPSRLKHDWGLLNDRVDVTTTDESDECYSYLATMHRNHTVLLSSDLRLNPTLEEQSRETGFARPSHRDRGRRPRPHPVPVPGCLCVEIKPKAGYLPTSPLVLRDHRAAKFRHHRYGIMQRLMAEGRVSPRGWGTLRTNTSSSGSGGGKPEISDYSPLDLFSGDVDRMTESLHCLFDNPQNNLRLWYDGNLILGHELCPSREQRAEVLRDVFMVDNGAVVGTDAHRRLLVEHVVNAASKILHREPLLSNLLSMQETNDPLDVDGAVEVYERLVELCDGSHEGAEAELDFHASCSAPRPSGATVDAGDGSSNSGGRCVVAEASSDQPAEDQTSAFSSPVLAPSSMPQCDVLRMLCDEVNEFRHSSLLVMNSGESEMDDETTAMMDGAYRRAMDLVKNLSKEGCIWLLRGWLFSLNMRDVSLLLTMRRRNNSDEICTRKLEGRNNGEARAALGGDDGVHSSPQTRDRVGSFLMCDEIDDFGTRSSDDDQIRNPRAPRGKVLFDYLLKVIDCDPKPGRKLRKRKEAEEVVKYFK